MAQGTDHIAAGVVVGIISLLLFPSYVTSLGRLALLLLCAVAGSLFPDIDIKSKGQRFFFSIMAPLYVFLFMREQYVLCGSLVCVALLPAFVSHRGIFHRFWFILAIACMSGMAMASIYPVHKEFIKIGTIVFLLGALSHLVLDFGVVGLLHKK